MNQEVQHAVAALVAARRSHQPVSSLQTPIRSPEAAYAVQDGVGYVMGWFDGVDVPVHWKSGGPARDAELTQVPQLHPAAAAVAAEDGEARAWWRNLPVDERSKIMQVLQDDPAAAQKYERLQLALLRSPVPLPDLEVKHIGELWKQTKRLDNPAEALAIDSLHRAHDWSERVLGHVAGIASIAVGLSRAEILDTLAAAGGPALEGAGVFGFDDAAIAQGVRVVEARKAAQAVSKA